MSIFPPAFFVTGTDTGIGKTFVSAVLTVGLNAAYWKPIQSGFSPADPGDREWIRQVTGLENRRFHPEAYLLSRPLSPHAAAVLDDLYIDLETIRLPGENFLPHLIVEGAGGVMVPINMRQTMIDLILHLHLPALVVAANRLGTINHTLLTLEKLRDKGVPVIGVVLNGPRDPINRRAIEEFGKVTVLAELETIEKIDYHALLDVFVERFGSCYAAGLGAASGG